MATKKSKPKTVVLKTSNRADTKEAAAREQKAHKALTTLLKSVGASSGVLIFHTDKGDKISTVASLKGVAASVHILESFGKVYEQLGETVAEAAIVELLGSIGGSKSKAKKGKK